jgi:hypothetical protein
MNRKQIEEAVGKRTVAMTLLLRKESQEARPGAPSTCTCCSSLPGTPETLSAPAATSRSMSPRHPTLTGLEQEPRPPLGFIAGRADGRFMLFISGSNDATGIRLPELPAGHLQHLDVVRLETIINRSDARHGRRCDCKRFCLEGVSCLPDWQPVAPRPTRPRPSQNARL